VIQHCQSDPAGASPTGACRPSHQHKEASPLITTSWTTSHNPAQIGPTVKEAAPPVPNTDQRPYDRST